MLESRNSASALSIKVSRSSLILIAISILSSKKLSNLPVFAANAPFSNSWYSFLVEISKALNASLMSCICCMSFTSLVSSLILFFSWDSFSYFLPIWAIIVGLSPSPPVAVPAGSIVVVPEVTVPPELELDVVVLEVVVPPVPSIVVPEVAVPPELSVVVPEFAGPDVVVSEVVVPSAFYVVVVVVVELVELDELVVPSGFVVVVDVVIEPSGFVVVVVTVIEPSAFSVVVVDVEEV